MPISYEIIGRKCSQIRRVLTCLLLSHHITEHGNCLPILVDTCQIWAYKSWKMHCLGHDSKKWKTFYIFVTIMKLKGIKMIGGFKVRKLIAAAQKSLVKFGVFEQHLAVDEMIVKYYSHIILKQFIRGKPIRFGYKFWALCCVSGYCYNFDLYCGKSSSEDKHADCLDQKLYWTC